MQKFGLDSITSNQNSIIEKEIVKEKASALGMAGKKLQQAIDEYNNHPFVNTDSDEAKAFLDNIYQLAHELILQREFTGFIHNNVEWIKNHFSLPEQVLKKL